MSRASAGAASASGDPAAPAVTDAPRPGPARPAHGGDLRERLTERVEALRAEYAKGETAIATLDAQRQATCETMLRIAGAIQVLQEELAAGQPLVALAGESVTR